MPGQTSVLNTGELSDSLAWDHKTGLSTNLINLFANQRKHRVLFLTKSTRIENIEREDPDRQVIISFSINASEVSAAYEKKAPSPTDRISAAKRLIERGWEVRIRLDPMVPVEGWKDYYAQIIDLINETGPEIVTLGSLRYFRPLVNFSSDNTDIFSFGKNQGDPDNRIRVPKETRLEMYSFAKNVSHVKK